MVTSKSPDAENADLQRMQVGAWWGLFYAAPFRTLSLLAALGLTAFILIYPKALVVAGQVNHGLLGLLMTGVAAGFVHGSGFVPRMLLWRLLFSPLVAWPLLALGYWVMA